MFQSNTSLTEYVIIEINMPKIDASTIQHNDVELLICTDHACGSLIR